MSTFCMDPGVLAKRPCYLASYRRGDIEYQRPDFVWPLTIRVAVAAWNPPVGLRFQQLVEILDSCFILLLAKCNRGRVKRGKDGPFSCQATGSHQALLSDGIVLSNLKAQDLRPCINLVERLPVGVIQFVLHKRVRLPACSWHIPHPP